MLRADTPASLHVLKMPLRKKPLLYHYLFCYMERPQILLVSVCVVIKGHTWFLTWTTIPLSYLKPSKEFQVSLMPALARVHIFQNDPLPVRVCLDPPLTILAQQSLGTCL